MNRRQAEGEIKETFGIVPSMFKAVPESTIGPEWELFKKVQLDDGPIPQKYRELIGIAISGVTKCRYCAYYHTEVAKLYGATEEEIEAAIHYAKQTAGWSTYINGLQIPFEQFKDEIDHACEHIRSHSSQKEMA